MKEYLDDSNFNSKNSLPYTRKEYPPITVSFRAEFTAEFKKEKLDEILGGTSAFPEHLKTNNKSKRKEFSKNTLATDTATQYMDDIYPDPDKTDIAKALIRAGCIDKEQLRQKNNHSLSSKAKEIINNAVANIDTAPSGP